MTSHELARKLLELPDLPVLVPDDTLCMGYKRLAESEPRHVPPKDGDTTLVPYCERGEHISIE